MTDSRMPRGIKVTLSSGEMEAVRRVADQRTDATEAERDAWRRGLTGGTITVRTGTCARCRAAITDYQGHRLLCPRKITCPGCGGSPVRACSHGCECQLWPDEA